MLVIDWLRWRISERRVREAAARMLESSGDQAFLDCHAEYWRAQRAGEALRARFAKAVCAELARAIQRREVLRAMIGPCGEAKRRAVAPLPTMTRLPTTTRSARRSAAFGRRGGMRASS